MAKNTDSPAQLKPLKPGELGKHHFGEDGGYASLANIHHIFHINRLEDVAPMIKFPLAPHRKTVNDFIFLTQGTSIRSKGLQQYQFGPNSMFVLPAFQISSHEYLSPDSKGFFCHFDDQIFTENNFHVDLLLEFPFWKYTARPVLQLPEPTCGPICAILERLLSYYENVAQPNTKLLATYLLALFYELKVSANTATDTSKNAAMRIAEAYKNLLSQHIFQLNRVADYAAMLHISPDHLNKCVKLSTGLSSQQLMADMMVLEAKVLLKQSNLSINEIAFKFSEGNASDFARFFKSKTGQSPKAYRKRTE